MYITKQKKQAGVFFKDCIKVNNAVLIHLSLINVYFKATKMIENVESVKG